MYVLGIIPARAGSTRVPGKNIRPFAGGDPLIVRAIRAGLESGLDRVVLSTDSEEYADLGRRSGAEVPFLRPAEFASTEATAMSVVRHCLAHFELSEGLVPDAVAYLQPTSPFRTAGHIDDGIELLDKADADTVLSMEPVHQLPSFMWHIDEEGHHNRVTPDMKRPERSQDQPPFYLESTTIVISRTGYITAAADNALVMNHESLVPLVIDRESAIDINTEQDFAYAEFVAYQRRAGARREHK